MRRACAIVIRNSSAIRLDELPHSLSRLPDFLGGVIPSIALDLSQYLLDVIQALNSVLLVARMGKHKTCHRMPQGHIDLIRPVRPNLRILRQLEGVRSCKS